MTCPPALKSAPALVKCGFYGKSCGNRQSATQSTRKFLVITRAKKTKVRKIISPTHERTEGFAPEWGSEFAIQVATLQGDSAESLYPGVGINLGLIAHVLSGPNN
jgi:hypothetical protein